MFNLSHVYVVLTAYLNENRSPVELAGCTVHATIDPINKQYFTYLSQLLLTVLLKQK